MHVAILSGNGCCQLGQQWALMSGFLLREVAMKSVACGCG
ncbi:hypothetical protein SALWKB12_0340 [Snodgrassella communis]|uniref:Uncharacterized protein n=1 Tax=Snodgrassella communis TaxID=2946699 RepID=A0A836MRL7_9NEIS|nr:hypothetical protein SALWKB12_0340 [Snodgrassella communis]KDN15781.1 hypothetical protein SALWKB29_0200 [Snodgrassella communis]